MEANVAPIRWRAIACVATLAACAAAPVSAGAPEAVTIVTTVVFDPNVSGTFVATGPICPSGTVSYVDDVVATGPAAFNVNGITRFDCDDNSGSFFIRLHAQAAARPHGFNLAGPWSVWGKGTGDYERLAGHGDFGVLFEANTDPLEGQETFVGFVTL